MGRRHVSRPVRILAALDLSHQSGREQLSGIYQYADTNTHWQISMVPGTESIYAAIINRMIASREIDGAILKADVPSVADHMAGSDVPVSFIDMPRSPTLHMRRNSAFILNDNAAIGEAAADHFCSLGRFASYAYLPPNLELEWSRVRERAFFARLAENGRKGFAKPPSHYGEDFEYAQRELAEWLAALPKPVAVFASFDMLAAHVVACCREMGIAVPDSVAVIGVDNDRIVCEHSRPQISSIRPNHEMQGFEAARQLDRLLWSRRTRAKATIVCCPHLGIVERGSTAALSPGLQLVERARAYIRENYAKGVSVSDIVRHLGVSARLANLRYSESEGESLQSALVGTRLESAKKLLSESRYQIGKIARLCGFRTPIAFSRLFARRFGMSPRDWRSRGFEPKKESPPWT